MELQALQSIVEWIVAVWQNRPHDGLRHALTSSKALIPNEQYAALVEITGMCRWRCPPNDDVELLPATWRVINTYGVKINNRVHDDKALNPYRRQHSGVAVRKGQWEVHYDPYDISRVWVRNHDYKGWLTVAWTPPAQRAGAGTGHGLGPCRQAAGRQRRRPGHRGRDRAGSGEPAGPRRTKGPAGGDRQSIKDRKVARHHRRANLATSPQAGPGGPARPAFQLLGAPIH